jgi:hypothetical protein
MRPADETQRVIAATLGVGLMLGAIAWFAAASAVSTWPWEARVFPAVGMFVLGAFIVRWAWRTRDEPQKPLFLTVVVVKAFRWMREHLPTVQIAVKGPVKPLPFFGAKRRRAKLKRTALALVADMNAYASTHKHQP